MWSASNVLNCCRNTGICVRKRKEAITCVRSLSSGSSSDGIYDRVLRYVDILYEDRHFLVANKPSGILSQPNMTSSPSSSALDMLTIYKSYLHHQRQANSANKSIDSVYLGLVHRLDRETSGVMVLAKTSKAAGRLSALLRDKSKALPNKANSDSTPLTKTYLCVVEGQVKQPSATLRHQLLVSSSTSSSSRSNKSHAITEKTQEAVLQYEVIHSFCITPNEVEKPIQIVQKNKTLKDYSLLQVELITGRKHQIRAQLSAIGHPIVNDVLYGASRLITASNGASDNVGIALHAHRLQFPHPIQQITDQDASTDSNKTRKDVDVIAPLPLSWKQWFDSCNVVKDPANRGMGSHSTDNCVGNASNNSVWKLIEQIVHNYSSCRSK